MTVFAIAWKDVKRIYRNAFTLIMMFAAPFLITGLLYFAFGRSEDGGGQSDTILLAIHNNDQGSDFLAAGDLLIEFFSSPDVSDVVEPVKTADDSALVLDIPPDFSEAILTGDPAFTLYAGPDMQVQRDIIQSMTTDFIVSVTETAAVMRMLAEESDRAGQPVRSDQLEKIAMLLTEEKRGSDHTATDHPATVLIMCAMIIFFMFFATSVTAQGLVLERENGTFQRMTVSPNGTGTILTGKFIGVALTAFLQAFVLFFLTSLIFGISWGDPIQLIVLTISLVIGASGFSIFVMSFLSNSRQIGPISSAVNTVAGMAGGLFTVAVPNMPAFFTTIMKLTPHGWAILGYESLVTSGGGSAVPVYTSAAVCGASGIVLLLAGALVLRRKVS